MVIRSLMIFCFFIFLGSSNMTAQEYDYIGAAKCKMCHNKPATGQQYKIWSEGPHAKAMESLSAEEAKDPKCLKCHSTYYSVDEAYIATLTPEEGVSCETCHGPGSGYKSNAIMKDQAKSIEKGLIIPDENLCRTCHNEESPTFKGFNYDEYLKKIAHPVPAAE